MKKIIALALVIVMCLSFAACSGGETTNNTPNTQIMDEVLIGTWSCEREPGQDNVTQASVYTIELYKGGSCYKYNLGKDNGNKYNNISGTWSVDGDILTITLPKASLGFVIDTTKTPYTLTKQIDNSVVLQKEDM